VYLVDELTAVGDEVFRAKSQLAFEQMRSRATLVFVSHNLKLIESVCDSGILIRDGQLEYHDQVRDAIRAYQRLVSGPAESGKS
jgi:capsular polysaccharide transport system ATP-binding protein